MLKKYFFFTIISLALLGCSNDPYEQYIGFWEKQDTTGYEVVEVMKDGETFILKVSLIESSIDLWT